MWVLTLLRRLWAGPQSDRCMSDGTVSGPTAPCVARSVAAVAASVGRAFVSGLSILRPSARLLRAKRCLGGLADRFPALRAPLAAALFVLSLLISLASAAQAQTATTLVSNTAQRGSGILYATEVGTTFTTGSSSAGYTLTSVGIRLNDVADRSTVVTIREGKNLTPGDLVAMLINPNSFTANAVNTFTAPAGTLLLPNTTYFLMVNDGRSGSLSSNVSLTTTRSDRETGATGWSISNETYRVDPGGGLTAGSQAIRFEIRGQTNEQVSNTGQSAVQSTNLEFATPFTTGSTAASYTISQVNIRLGPNSDRTLSVAIRENGNNNRPGALVAKLTNPTTRTNNALNTFTAPAGTQLLANTTYWLVFNDGRANNRTQNPTVGITEADGQTGATGWSIANGSRINGQGSTGFPDRNDASMIFQINGQADTTAVYQIRSSPVNIVEGGPDNRCSFRRDSGTALVASLNYEITETGDMLNPARKGKFSRELSQSQQSLSHVTNHRLQTVDDNIDEPRSTVTCKLLPGTGYTIGSTGQQSFVVEDNEPTTVSLVRTGSGAIEEGETAEFTVRLSRALVAGEVIDVPLAMTNGRNVTPDEWSLALKSGQTLNTGVTLTGESTATPQLRFEGAASETATLVLTSVQDVVSESDETITVALGPDGDVANGFDRGSLGTNVGGGADPAVDAGDRTFDVVVTNVQPPSAGVTIVVTDDTATEGSTTEDATFTVVLNTEPTSAVTVTVTAPAGLSLDGPDSATTFMASEALTFSTINWDMPQTVTVRATEDSEDSPSGRDLNVAYTATSSDDDYNSLSGTAATVTVTDNDPTIVSLSRTDSGEIEEGETAEFTVTLGRALVAGEVIDVPLLLIGSSGVTPANWSLALKSGDSLNTGVTLTGESTNTPQVAFSGAGSQTATLVLTAVQDVVSKKSQGAITVRLGPDGTRSLGFDRSGLNTNVGGGANPASSDNLFNVLVTDDDAAPTGVELSVDPGTVAEDGGATEIEVTAALSGGTTFGEAKTVTVAVGAGNDSAIEGTDYATVDDQTITIGAGESTGTVTFTLTPRQDTTSEGDEAISLTPTVAGVAETFGLTPATIDLTDDEALPVVALALSPASIDESGASNSATVTAMLTGVVSSEDIVLTVAAAPGADTEAADYRLAGTTLTIPAGQSTSTGTVTITAVDNAVDAANKAVTVSATVSGGNGVAAPEDVTLTITDDDDAGVTVTPTSVRVTEASGAGNTATYEVVLDRAPTADVTITVTSGDTDAATVDTDTITSGLQSTLTFTSSNWETAQEVTITGVDDNVDQNPDRTLTISHSAASSDTDYNAINIADVAVTVVDDDGGPTIAIDSMSIAEGQTKTFTVTNVPSGWGRPEVSNDVDAEDTAAFATACATAGTNNDVCVLNPRDATWNPTSRTFVFTLRADLDGVAEETETFTLVLVDSSEARTPPVSFEMQVLNTPLSVISIDTPSVVEGADDTTVSLEFSVTLDRASPQEITVDFADTTTGTATSATDYATVSTGTLTFAAGETSKTISVSVNGDDIDESNETIILRLSNATGATLSGGSSTLVGTGTITDDDAAPTGVALSVDPGTVAENGGATPFEVTAALSGGTTFDEAKTVTVAVGAASDSATEGTDYATVGDQTITIGAGESTGTVTFTLTPMQDTTSEGVEVISLTPTVAGVAETFGLTPATIDLTDDEALPVVALALSPASIDESGASNSATVTATLTGAVSDQAIVLTVAAAPGADTEAADYRLAGTTLTIPAGQSTSTGTVTITAVDNAVDAANKAVTVSATVSGGNGVAAPEDVTLTITDDDAAPTGVTLSVDPGTVAENGGATPFEVTAALSGGTTFDEAKTVTVAVGAASDSATEATDYTAVDDQTITIGAGESTGTVTFTLIPMQDTTSEGDEAISLTPTVAGVAETFGLTPATIDLTDDEALPVVALALSPASIDESGASNSATVTATLTGAVSSEAIVLTVAAAPGADTEAADYRLAGTTLTIPAGQSTSTGTVTITAVDNAVDAANKAVTVSATVSGGNGVAAPEDVTLTITDDDAAPTGVALSVDPGTVAENGGATPFEVTAALSGGTTFDEAKTVTVAVGAASDSATEATDYTAVDDQTITIGAGESTGTVTFTLIPMQDTTSEGDEAISLTPTVAGVAETFGLTPATIDLTDDEALPVVALALSPASIDESGASNSATVTATLTGAVSSEAIVLTVAAAPGADTEAADYRLAGTTLTIPAGQSTSTGTVTITAVDNAVDAANKAVTVSATVSGGNGVAAPEDVTLTITDDDAAPTGVALSVDPGTVAENGGATPFEVTAALSGGTTFDEAKTVTVAVGAASDSATEATDYTAVDDQTITIGAGESTGTVTFTLIPMQDTTSEGDEAISLTPTVAGVAETFGLTPATIDLTDDEALPVVALALSPASIDESGASNSATVTATLTGAESSEDIVLTVAAAPGADTEAADYRLAGTTLTIPAGQSTSTGTVTITAVDNAVDAANKAVTVSATVSGGNGVAAPEDVTLTITDDDAAPTGVTLSVDPGTVAENGGATPFEVTAALSGGTTFGEAKTVTVAVGAASDSATEATDYATVGDQTITIGAGESTGTVTFTLTPTDESTSEGVEAISLTPTVAGVAETFGLTPATIDLTDDEALPVVALALSPASIDESGASNSATVTATLTGAVSSEAIVLTVAAAPGADTEAADYRLAGTTLTIPAGQSTSTGTVTITAVDNAVDAANKAVTVSATVSGGNGVAAPEDVTLTITDDDAAPTGVTLSVDPGTVAENGGATPFEVTAALSGGTTFGEAKTVTVAVGAASDSATEATDYTAVDDQTITIGAGESTGTVTFTLTPMQDTTSEGDEAISLTPTVAGVGETFRRGGTTITITDDEPLAVAALALPVVALALSPASIDESGASNSATVTATLTGAESSEDIVLTVAAAPGADTEAADYRLAGTTLTIPAGQSTSTGTVTITAVDNAVDAANKAVTVSATVSGGNGVAAPEDVTLTITDDDAAPTGVTLSVDPGTVAENGGATPFEVTAALSGGTTFGEAKTVTVAVGAASDSATEGTDYATVGDQTITIGAGESTGTVTFTLTPTDESTSEGVEAISLTPTVAGVAETFGLTPATIDLTDDEALPVVALALSPASIDESGASNSATVTATLTGAVSSEAIVLTVAAAPGADTEAADYRLAGTTLTIPAGQSTSTGTVTITAVDNAVDAANKAVTVSATVSGGNGVAAPEDVTLTITDDDAAGVLVSETELTVTEASGAGNTATYEVVLDSAPSANVTITVISGDTDAATVSTANRQGTLVFTSGNWNIGQEVTVTGVDDSVNQSADRALTIRHRATSSDTNYHTIAIASVAVTIIDDDDADLADQVVRPALTRFGRTVGEQVLGAVTDRLGDNRRPGFEGRLAGEALPRVTPEPDDWQQSCSKLRPCTRPQVVPDRKDGHRPAGEGGVGAVPAEDIQTWRPGDRRVREDESVTRGVTEDDLITSTAFALTAETEADTSVALWGRGAQSGFSGSAGSLDVDGEVTSFMVGADWERNSRLFGMMLSQSRGRIDYTLDDVSGEIEANLTALVPYAGWQVTDHLRAWGVMGLGSGDMILTPEADSGRLKTDIDWYMAAGGVTGDLRSVDALEGARLQWSADALWTRTTSEAVPGLSASAGATTRLRIGLESQWERILPSGATLTPRLDVGLRYDAGDAETGFGLGVGGGVDFFDPAHNLLLSLEGRTLVLHEAEALENWGLGFTMSYDPRPETKRGFTARVTQNFGGASSGGAATLLSPMVFPEAQKAESGGAWSLEAAYGMNRGRGMVGSTYSTLTGKSSIEGARLGFRTEPDAGHAKDITMDLWTDPAQKDAGASLNYRW